MATATVNRRPRIAATTYADPGLCLHIPRDAFTHSGFRKWVLADDFPEKVPVTFLSGEIYVDMSKEELATHSAVKTEVCLTVGNLNKEQQRGKLYINGVLVTNKEGKVSNNPDAVLVLFESLRSGRVRMTPRERRQGQFIEIQGSPDWLLEIVSDSSVRKDTIQLRRAYHRARVSEYWLIDARGEEIAFQILHWRKNGYVAAPTRDGWQKSRVFDREFRLERRRDEFGLWEYTLHVR